jgi:hypothetical protein
LAGHRGLVEPTPWRHFAAHRFRSLIGRTSRELDMPHTRAAEDFVCATRSEVVIAAAARVRDIPANDVLSSDHERPSAWDRRRDLDSGIGRHRNSGCWLSWRNSLKLQWPGRHGPAVKDGRSGSVACTCGFYANTDLARRRWTRSADEVVGRAVDLRHPAFEQVPKPVVSELASVDVQVRYLTGVESGPIPGRQFTLVDAWPRDR